MEDKKSFVEELSKVLNIAKPYMTCKYMLGKDIELITYEEKTYLLEHGNSPYAPKGEYVVVDCESGHHYVVCVTADSLAAIVLDVFRKIIYK